MMILFILVVVTPIVAAWVYLVSKQADEENTIDLTDEDIW
jgi:hypothetical protein